MNDIENLNGRISEKYFSIKKDILHWNFEKLSGIGQRRPHDRYAILELNIYTSENYPDRELLEKKYIDYNLSEHYLNNFSFLIWRIPESQFPKEIYEYGKNELTKSIEAAIDAFSLIKEQNLKLVFEIVWAGYGITDIWGKGAVYGAFMNAILSCFDNNLYNEGMKYKQNHPILDGVYQSRLS
jgi:hypothetical protein